MLCLTQQSDLSVLSWKITPGMEEGGGRQDSVHGSTNVAKDNLRDLWKKLIESEERLNFFRKMVGWELNVREIEHLGDDLNNKFKSDRMGNIFQLLVCVKAQFMCMQDFSIFSMKVGQKCQSFWRARYGWSKWTKRTTLSEKNAALVARDLWSIDIKHFTGMHAILKLGILLSVNVDTIDKQN